MLAVASRPGSVDLEAAEQALRGAVLAAGAKALGAFMTAVGSAAPTEPPRCADCSGAMQSTGPRRKTILTMLGEVSYTRSRYACAACNKSVRYPADDALDLVQTSRSPGVRRQVARLGAKQPFRDTATDLAELAGVHLSRKDAERIAENIGEDMERCDHTARLHIRLGHTPPVLENPPHTLYIELDGTGIPMVSSELRGRKGKQPDGSAKTREVKLGCVFTQTRTDPQGRPIRDPASTTYTGAIENAQTFGWRLYAHAVERGLHQASRVIVLSDGAEWIKNLAQTHFPNAQRILDLYHAKEHVAALCGLLFDNDLRTTTRYREQWWDWMDQGQIEDIVESASALLPNNPKAAKDARLQIAYLDKNKQCMSYHQYRQQELFVGSGVIEAACKNLVGKRLKQSGMEWTVRGANAIIALRCAELSNRTEQYWEQRTA
jgi:hypothetical protein